MATTGAEVKDEAREEKEEDKHKSSNNSSSKTEHDRPQTDKLNNTMTPTQQTNQEQHQSQDQERNKTPQGKQTGTTEEENNAQSENERIEQELEPMDRIDTETEEEIENEDNGNIPPLRTLRNWDKKQMDYAALHQGNMPPRRKNSSSKIIKKTAKNTPTDSNLQKNIDNMQKDLRKQRVAFDKKQEKLNKVKDDLDTKNNKLQKIKQTNEKLKSEEQQIADENEELKQENREIKEELNQIYNENDRLSASILNLQGELQQTKQKIEQLEQDNYNQRGEIRRLKTSNQDMAEQLVATQTSPQQDHQNICYVGDSNMIMIHACMEMENMQQYDLIKTFTIEEAISWANTTTTTLNTLHLIMVGTNNIKRGETANQCATKHAELTETLDNKGINYKVIQLPPSYWNSGRDTHFCSRETIKLNITLAQRHNTISMEDIKTDRNLIAHDGIHLTDGAYMMISNTIAKECLTTTAKDKDVRYDEESIRITVQD